MSAISARRPQLTPTPCAVDLSFGYGWRFHYGSEEGGGDGPFGGEGFESFTPLPDNAHCVNSDGTALEHNPNRFNEYDCEVGCMWSNYNGDDASDANAGDKCLLWQGDSESRKCYHSFDPNATCTAPSAGGSSGNLSGGVRDVSAVLPMEKDYEFAAANVDVDADWPVVDVPHDFSIENGTFAEGNDFKHGYLPRTTSWYRKHFTLPSEFDGRHLELLFEGCFHVCSVWLNGEFLSLHTAGYTEFTVRLDNSSSVHFGQEENVLAVRADASFGSGHWFEGGGLYRPVSLRVSDRDARLVHSGVFVSPEIAEPQAENPNAALIITSSVEVELSSSNDEFVVQTVLTNSTTGVVVATQNATVDGRGDAGDGATTTTVSLLLSVKEKDLQRWTTGSPAMLIANTTLSRGTEVFDSRASSVGFRSTKWNSTGFFLNGQQLPLAGFSHHNSLAGIGVAIPPRINLFKVQASKALGANVWRMSHNPYVDHLYEQLSIAGTVVWDESRDFGFEYRQQMADMVKAHRDHTSIVVWSYGNEYELQQVAQNSTNLAYREMALTNDPTRPTSENDNAKRPFGELHIDVQGWSHWGNSTFESFNSDHPDVPQVLSECCSCTSQRVGYNGNRQLASGIWTENSPMLLPYVAGSLGVWTLFDYFGEPDTKWPSVSCSFGQFDVIGLPKPHAYWYRSNWCRESWCREKNAGTARVFNLLDALTFETVNATHSSVVVNGIADGATAELIADGSSAGVVDITVGAYPDTVAPISWNVTRPGRQIDNCDDAHPFNVNLTSLQCKGLSKADAAVDADSCFDACCNSTTVACTVWQWDTNAGKGCWIGAVDFDQHCAENPGSDAEWVSFGTSAPVATPFDILNATMITRNAKGEQIARHVVLGTSSATERSLRVQLALDVPSVTTGTGSALVLDGEDTAMLRASLIDTDSGGLVSTESLNVSFEITSGPGRLVGVGSGDPKDHSLPKGDSVPLFGGLARAFVQVSVDATRDHRDLISAIDVDNGRRTTVITGDCDAVPIVVRVTATGGAASDEIRIPTSCSVEQDGWKTVAQSTATSAAFKMIDEFVG